MVSEWRKQLAIDELSEERRSSESGNEEETQSRLDLSKR
jgi:hypothetical protein